MADIRSTLSAAIDLSRIRRGDAEAQADAINALSNALQSFLVLREQLGTVGDWQPMAMAPAEIVLGGAGGNWNQITGYWNYLRLGDRTVLLNATVTASTMALSGSAAGVYLGMILPNAWTCLGLQSPTAPDRYTARVSQFLTNGTRVEVEVIATPGQYFLELHDVARAGGGFLQSGDLTFNFQLILPVNIM